MRTLIFSDTHLTTDFIEHKYALLERLISDADQVIINGDFWDGFQVSFDAFIKSEWSRLFPLLKSKKTVCIWGNHDHPDNMDERIYLFCDLHVPQYEVKAGDTHYIIEHGHRIDPLFGTSNPRWFFRLMAKIYDAIDGSLVETVEWLTFYKASVNMLHKRYVKRAILPGQVLVCGHSHKAAFEPTRRYVNTGRITWNAASYAIITEQDGLTLFTERY